MRRRRIPALTVVLALLTLAGCGSDTPEEPAGPAADRPNVLLIVLDTMRSDVFGCTGHPGDLTPRIDRLASEGVLYTRAYATDFWTLPSHASLLTGLYPTQCQATSETNHLPDQVTTLAERLSEAGYRTGAIVRNAWVSKERGFAQGFDEFVESWRTPARTSVGAEQAAAGRAVSWINKAAGEEAPFFLFLNFNIAHMPYQPSDSMWKHVRSQAWPEKRVNRLRSIAGMWAYLAGRIKLGGSDFTILRELYEAEVAHADTIVERILDALERTGAANETLVVLTSDHGENLGEHGMIDHLLSMYETTIHVPLIVRYPERFAPGTTIDDLVSLVDVTPTVLDVCGLPPLDTDDLGLTRNLASAEPEPRAYVVSENDRPVNGVKLLRKTFPRFDATSIDHSFRTLITARHKLIWRVGLGVEKTELYDLREDPGEMNNLAAKRTALRDELLTTLRRWTSVVGRHRIRAKPFEASDPDALERLRGLTYVR